MWGTGTVVLGGPTGGPVIINFIGNLVQEWTFRHGFSPRKSFSKPYSSRTCFFETSVVKVCSVLHSERIPGLGPAELC